MSGSWFRATTSVFFWASAGPAVARAASKPTTSIRAFVNTRMASSMWGVWSSGGFYQKRRSGRLGPASG